MSKKWKRSDGYFSHKLREFLPVKKLQKREKVMSFKVLLPNLDFSKLDQNELLMVEELRSCVLRYGYQVDEVTLAFFVVGKGRDAYKCLKRFISYCADSNNKYDERGICNYIASGTLHAIGTQCDDMMLIEIIMKNFNINTQCLHSVIHVILTNVFHHVTYETLKAGFAVVKDFCGWNVRFWQNRKVGYLMKTVNYVAELKLNIHVDQTKRFAGLAASFLRIVSPKVAQVTFFLRRQGVERKSHLGRDQWSDDIWQGKRLRELRTLYPRMRLSSALGGSDEHLLTLFTARECLLKNICQLTEIESSSTETESFSAESSNSSNPGSSEQKNH